MSSSTKTRGRPGWTDRLWLLASCFGTTAALTLAGLGAASPAEAVTIYRAADPGYALPWNGHYTWLGAYHNPAGSGLSWCTEIDATAPAPNNVVSTYEITGNSNMMPLGGEDVSLHSSAQMRWILDTYENVATADSRAAISVIVHLNYDATNADSWGKYWGMVQSRYPQVAKLVRDYVHQAKVNAPWQGAAPEAKTENKRIGDVHNIGVQNQDGGWIAGIPVTVTLDGPAVFDETGTNTWSGQTQNQPLTLKWHATGNGKVMFKTRFNQAYWVNKIQSSPGRQDMIYRWGDPREVTVPGNPVDVVMEFQPQAVSNVGTAKVVDKTVKTLNDTLSVSAGGGTQWMDGVKIKFVGTAYYAGTKLPAESKNIPKDAVKLGTVEITADKPGDYPATLKLDKPVKPGFVTWVWRMDKASQDASVREYIKGDWADSYGLADETTSVREQAKIVTKASVSENAKAGSWKLSDAVEIAGMPADHPSFKAQAGFKADTEHVDMELWFFPDGTPVTDANLTKAEKIGATVQLPAKNGKYTANHDSWTAKLAKDKTRVPGTYVFISKFAGDDRVAPYTSSVTEKSEQYVVPKVDLKTTALSGVGDKVIASLPDEKVVDKVCYTNLIPGKEYEVSGTLMDKSTGKPLVKGRWKSEAEKAKEEGGKPATEAPEENTPREEGTPEAPKADETKPATDTNGEVEVYKASTKFTPDKAAGCVDVVFTVDGRDLMGRSTVVFEDLYRDKLPIAVHADINDHDQELPPPPEVRTTATGIDGTKDIDAKPNQTITDKVCYTNLIPGKEYSLDGTLMDKSTGKPVMDGSMHPLKANKKFTPKEAAGCVDMEFVVDGRLLTKAPTVVFEDLYQGERKVAVHADINDEGQTIPPAPEVKTTATDKADGDKFIEPKADQVITDKVCYTGLKPGKAYKLAGTLMDKATGEPVKTADGGDVVAEREFTPEKPAGCTEVEFTVNGSALAGRDLVVFESLLHQGREVALHADITDEGQTVKVKTPPPSLAKTGSTAGMFAILACVLMGMGVATTTTRRKINA